MIIDYTDRISFKTHSYKRLGEYIKRLAKYAKDNNIAIIICKHKDRKQHA